MKPFRTDAEGMGNASTPSRRNALIFLEQRQQAARTRLHAAQESLRAYQVMFRVNPSDETREWVVEAEVELDDALANGQEWGVA